MKAIDGKFAYRNEKKNNYYFLKKSRKYLAIRNKCIIFVENN
jgi:hypothetical protein